MTGLLLTCLLGLAPGIQLADSAPHRRVHLVNYAQDAGLDRMTKDDLLNELNRLDRTKPTLTSPIVLLSLGGALFITGSVLFAIYSGAYSAAVELGVGGLLILGGGVLLIVGVILLVTHLVALGNYHAQVDEVQKELDYLSRLPGGRRPTELPPPPPPPPPPPGAGFIEPAPGMVVATF